MILIKWIKIISYNLLIFFAILIIAELFLGKWGNDDHPLLEYQIFNKTYIDRSPIDIIPEKIVIYPKPNGFRYFSDVNLEKNKDCLIITMGGSTTQQFIMSDEETWSHKLQNKLNSSKIRIDDNCSGRYIVMNVGMSGHNLLNNRWLLKNYIHTSKLYPKAIIIYQGINDRYPSLNVDAKFMLLRDIKHEIVHDLQYKSFFINSINKIVKSYNEPELNNIVDHNYNNDGLLFRIELEGKKTENEFVYEKLDKNYIKNFNTLNGVKYHRKTIQRFISFSQKHFPKTKLIFITQTKPTCDLTDFPNNLGYMNSIENKTNKLPENFNHDDWLSPRGDCFRLGIIKSNYLSIIAENQNIKVIDYAGKFVEKLDESYDGYHKTPKGSDLFINRVINSLLMGIIN